MAIKIKSKTPNPEVKADPVPVDIVKEKVQIPAQSGKRAKKVKEPDPPVEEAVEVSAAPPEVYPKDILLPSINPISPLMKAVRAKCLDCCGGLREEVKYCTVQTCPLHPYRSGKNPFNKRGAMMSEEERERRTARMKKFWEDKKKAEK